MTQDEWEAIKAEAERNVSRKLTLDYVAPPYDEDVLEQRARDRGPPEPRKPTEHHLTDHVIARMIAAAEGRAVAEAEARMGALLQAREKRLLDLIQDQAKAIKAVLEALEITRTELEKKIDAARVERAAEKQWDETLLPNPLEGRRRLLQS
jgi:ATP-dependent Clp protease ATP-binding subunit ClpA